MNERIKELRKSLGLTLEKFGDRLGVTKMTISRLENSVNAVTEQMFKSICREFNVNPEWLRTGEGDMFIGLTKDENLAKWMGEIMGGKRPDFQIEFIRVLSQLDESDWELIERFVNKLSKKES